MDLLCPSPVVPMPTRLAALGAATAALAFGATASQASIVAVPASIVGQVDDPRVGTIFDRDAVDGFGDLLGFGDQDDLRGVGGVWLTRASLPVAGDPGSGTTGPEPATWLLMSGGVVVALAERRRAVRQCDAAHSPAQ